MGRCRQPWPTIVTLCIGLITIPGCQAAIPGNGSFARPTSGTEPTDDASDVSDGLEHPDLRGLATCVNESPVPEHDGIGSISKVEVHGLGFAVDFTVELTKPPPPGVYQDVGIDAIGDGHEIQVGAVFPADGPAQLYVDNLVTDEITYAEATPTVTGNTVTFKVPAGAFNPVGAQWRWYAYNLTEQSEEDCPANSPDNQGDSFLDFPK